MQVLEKFLSWFHPEHAEAGAAVFADIQARLSKLEAAVFTAAATEAASQVTPAEPPQAQ